MGSPLSSILANLLMEVLEKPISKACPSYVKTTTDKIGKRTKKHKMGTAFTTHKKNNNIFPHHKRRTTGQNNGKIIPGKSNIQRQYENNT